MARITHNPNSEPKVEDGFLIALPLRGRIESLGVSAAAAAILYEILQSREGGLDNAS